MSEATKAGEIVKAGSPVAANFKSPLTPGNEGGGGDLSDVEKANVAKGLNPDGSEKTDGGGGELTAEKKAANLAAGLNEDGSAKTNELTAEKKAENLAAGLNEDGSAKTPALSDDELRIEFEKRFPKKVDLTPEQITAAEEALDKRMLDLYVENGGNIAQYALLKSIASADLTELSKAELAKELKDAGITDQVQIDAIQRERYYQIAQEDIDKIEDVAEKELAQKKLEFGKKKFEGKGAHTQQQAKEFFNTLKSAIVEKDAQVTKESELASNVEAHFKTLPRNISIKLGMVDDTELTPVSFDIPETAFTEATAIMKDPVSRKKLLFTDDGNLNLTRIGELVLKEKMFDAAVKTSLLEGADRQVKQFQEVFPFIDPKAIGVGGSAKTPKGKGQIVKAGLPQKFNLAVKQ